MNTVDLIIGVLGAAATGCILGVFIGLNSERKRILSFISFLGNHMERLRDDSKFRAALRDIAKNYGDNDRADKITTELAAESIVFMDIQRAISDWCAANNEKDPFTL